MGARKKKVLKNVMIKMFVLCRKNFKSHKTKTKLFVHFQVV